MYTFKKTELINERNQSERLIELHGSSVNSCICRIFDEDINPAGPSEEECALILGKIWALFGKPDDPKMSPSDFYNYAVAAENKDGNILYFSIYQYSGMPSIGGPSGEGFEIFEAAASELKELINSTKPADYEWNGTYENYDVGMKYYVKDGIAGAEDSYVRRMKKYGFGPDEYVDMCSKIYDIMPYEEATKWSNKGINEQLDYFIENLDLFRELGCVK